MKWKEDRNQFKGKSDSIEVVTNEGRGGDEAGRKEVMRHRSRRGRSEDNVDKWLIQEEKKKKKKRRDEKVDVRRKRGWWMAKVGRRKEELR